MRQLRHPAAKSSAQLLRRVFRLATNGNDASAPPFLRARALVAHLCGLLSARGLRRDLYWSDAVRILRDVVRNPVYARRIGVGGGDGGRGGEDAPNQWKQLVEAAFGLFKEPPKSRLTDKN